MWHKRQRQPGSQKDWDPWSPLGRPPSEHFEPDKAVTEVAAGAHADGRLVVFAIAAQPDGPGIWQREQTGHDNGWTPWRTFGQPGNDLDPSLHEINSPVLALDSTGRLTLYFLVKATMDLYLLRQSHPSGTEWAAAWLNLQPQPAST